jgi:hypothetical protein
MGLHELLKKFCIEAYRVLLTINELPRPPFDAPLIARNPFYTVPLSEMDSYNQLKKYMLSSGLAEKLHEIGHTWMWHEEVFHWLFLERVIAESKGMSLDDKAFERVYRRAKVELNRPDFIQRRIVVLIGVPQFKSLIILQPGVRLRAIDYQSSGYETSKLLGWRYQDKNRAPSFWIDSRSCLLIQDRVVKKGNEGRDLLTTREEMREQAQLVLKSLRLSVDSPVYPKETFASYLSCFPLLPVAYDEMEEFRDISVEVGRPISKSEARDLRTLFTFLSKSGAKESDTEQFFISALDRFNISFRFRDIQQSIVDLVVALEALFHVGEELRYRLASRVAALLGTNDHERNRFFRSTYAGYKLRNAIVHGHGDQTENTAKALKEMFPELKSKTTIEANKHIRSAVRELQFIVRHSLQSYIHMKLHHATAQWPNEEDFDYLPFDSKGRRKTQKQLGITHITPEKTKVTYWHSIG